MLYICMYVCMCICIILLYEYLVTVIEQIHMIISTCIIDLKHKGCIPMEVTIRCCMVNVLA